MPHSFRAAACRVTALVGIVGFTLLAPACGDCPSTTTGDASAPPDATVGGHDVCDGSEDLRLMIAVVVPLDSTGPDETLLVENGAYFLLDGQCRYWAKSAEDKWAEVRTGEMDEPTLASFLADMRYAQWSELDGVFGPGPGAFDAGTLIFMDPANQIVCYEGCGSDATPDEVQAARDAFVPWQVRLWDAGTPVDREMRITVFESGHINLERFPQIPWPLESAALASVAVPIEEVAFTSFGDGTLIVDTADTEVLRQIRREYMEGEHGSWWYRFIPIMSEDGRMFELYMRDTTPFENGRGLLEWLHR